MVQIYEHAPNDAQLYRLPEILGGGVFPAVHVSGGPAHEEVQLDIPGVGLVAFSSADALWHIPKPNDMPVWLPALLEALTRFEQSCDHPPLQDGYCFGQELAEIPEGFRSYCAAVEEATGRAWGLPRR